MKDDRPTYLYTMARDPDGPEGSVLVRRHLVRRRGGFGPETVVGRAPSVGEAMSKRLVPRGATPLDNRPGPASTPGVLHCYLGD